MSLVAMQQNYCRFTVQPNLSKLFLPFRSVQWQWIVSAEEVPVSNPSEAKPIPITDRRHRPEVPVLDPNARIPVTEPEPGGPLLGRAVRRRTRRQTRRDWPVVPEISGQITDPWPKREPDLPNYLIVWKAVQRVPVSPTRIRNRCCSTECPTSWTVTSHATGTWSFYLHNVNVSVCMNT